MSEDEYQAGLACLRLEWGGLHVDDNDMPGAVRANNDHLTGFVVGLRSKLIAEIINRALRGDQA